MSDINIITEGPIFDGRIVSHIKSGIEEAIHDIAPYVHDELVDVLKRSFKNGTGAYVSRIDTTFVNSSLAVDDGGSVYGPWLEGVGSRNATTRFKGYASFRRTAQKLQNDRHIEDVVKQNVMKRIGG